MASAWAVACHGKPLLWPRFRRLNAAVSYYGALSKTCHHGEDDHAPFLPLTATRTWDCLNSWPPPHRR